MVDTSLPPFAIGDWVEMIAAPGAHLMVVDLNPPNTSRPRPCVTVAWMTEGGGRIEGVVEAKQLRRVDPSPPRA